MKITYIANSTIPSKSANSVHVMKICEAFSAVGQDVTLIVPNHDDTKNCDIYKFYGIKQHFSIIKNKLVKSPTGIYNYIFAASSVLMAMFKRSNLVFTRSPLVSFFCILFRKKHVLELHGLLNAHSRLLSKLFSRLKLFNSPKLLFVIVISNPLKKIYLDDFFVAEEKIIVLPDGVTYSNFEQFNNKLPFEKKQISVGYVGSLHGGRGIDIIIKVAKHIPEVQFNVYGGEAGQVDKAKIEIEKFGLCNIKFHGHVPNCDVPRILCEQDILLMPYQPSVQIRGGEDTSSWMSPMKMFEYMASGRVIVSSDMLVLREILNNENSYLVNPLDEEEWIGAIEYIRNNKEEAIGKTIFALRDIKNYTWVARTEKIIKAINE